MPTTFSGPEIVLTPLADNQAYGVATVLSDGNLLVTWAENGSLYARRLDTHGAPLGDSFVVFSGISFDGRYGVGFFGDYSVAAGDNGGFIVALPAMEDAYIAVVSGTNAVTTAIINTTRELEQHNLKIARLADDRFVVTWNTENGSFFRLLDAAGAPQGADASWGAAGVTITSIASLANGGLAVTQTRPGAVTGLQLYSGPTLTPGPIVPVSATSSGYDGGSQVTVLADGRIAVVWTNITTTNWTNNYSVRGRVFDAAGNPATGVFDANLEYGGAQSSPRIAALPDGGFFVAWSSIGTSGGNGEDAYGQRFDAMGYPVSRQISMIQNMVGHQARTDILVMPDGRLAAVYDNYSNQWDIYLQFFDSIVDPLEGVLTGDGGPNVLVGADMITNRLYGEGGNDFLRGLGGVDLLYGGDGDDKLEGGINPDVLDGGAGFDIASYYNARGHSDGVTGLRISLSDPLVNSVDAVGDSYLNIEGLSGSYYRDDLIGDGNANGLWGAQGNDTLWGQGGDDALYGNEDDDWLVGGLGADKLDGGEGFDTAGYSYAATGLRADLKDWWTNTGDAQGDSYYGIEALLGSEMSDLLLGDGSANRIDGAEGNDWLWGREGNDTLVGGAGRDRFCFDTGWGADTITDFNRSQSDVLDFLGVAGLTSFGQLALTTGAGGLTVSFGGSSVFLQSVASITAADCVFG